MIPIEGPRVDLASRDKVWGSSAYQCPELLPYAQSSDGNTEVQDVGKQLTTAFRIDLWSFGTTLYEISTGLPLVEHQCVWRARVDSVLMEANGVLYFSRYDRVTNRGEKLLQSWQGLTPVHVRAIESLCVFLILVIF